MLSQEMFKRELLYFNIIKTQLFINILLQHIQIKLNSNGLY